MPNQAKNVDAYLASLPPDRRAALGAVLRTLRENLGKGYEEGILYGMIGYYVPHALHPAGYHANPKQPLPFVALGSQKNHMALYLFCLAGDGEAAFREAWAASGKKLDMGKSCVRFRAVDELALDVIGRTIRALPVKTFVARYLAQLGPRAVSAEKRAAPPTAKKTTPKKTTPKKSAAAGKKTVAAAKAKPARKPR